MKGEAVSRASQVGAADPAATGDPRAGAVARAGRYARYVFWLMFAINFLNYADRWVFSALANELKSAFRFDDFQIGVLGSAFLLVYTLVAFPTGYFADRLGRKNVVAAGVALWSAATALTAVAGNFAVMLVVRALVGVGEGSYYPAGTSLLSAYYPPQRRATILGRWATGALAGAAIGFLIAGLKTAFESVALPASVLLTSGLIELWGYRAIFVVVTIGLLSAMYDEKRLHQEVAPRILQLSAAIGGLLEGADGELFSDRAPRKPVPVPSPNNNKIVKTEVANDLEAGARRPRQARSVRAPDGRRG